LEYLEKRLIIGSCGKPILEIDRKRAYI